MVTRQQSTSNTLVHSRTYVSGAGATPSVTRAAWLIAVCEAAQGFLWRAATDLQSHRSSTSIIAANDAICNESTAVFRPT